MGFFTKPDAAPPAAGDFTFERITAGLEQRGWNFGVDDEGPRAHGRWDGHPFTFETSGKEGEIMYVRGRWNRDVPLTEYDVICERANDWHARTHWPKIVVRKFDDGTVGVFGELSVNYRTGVGDEMVSDHLWCGIATALQFFEELDEAYPEAAAAAKAAEESGES